MTSPLKHLAANFALVLASVAVFDLTGFGSAQAQQIFRIGTGGTGGTYHPVGGVIASAISQPGKIAASALISKGSVANINDLVSGAIESGFSQADVAFWAYSGTGVWEGRTRVRDLRIIANLYPESVHIVVKKGSGIKTVADLKGKRVALDEPDSGTVIGAKMILAAYGLKETDIRPEFIKADLAADKLKSGTLDAFFFTGGAPAGAIADLASMAGGIELVAIDGPQAEGLLQASAFFSPDRIAAGTYKGVGVTKTLAVGAQWVTSAKTDTATVYEITKAIFSEAAQKSINASHAQGVFVTVGNAVRGVAIPFHPGAEKFYREAGALK
jgi:uncharacterized protein